MERARRRRRRSRDEINTLVEQFDRSGLSQVAFARRKGLSLSTLRRWLERRRRQAGIAPRFVPVSVAGAGLAAVGLELELAGDRRLHIPVDIDREALRALLPVVLGAC